MKILLAPVNTAGYYSQLLQGFREIGIYCDLATHSHHPFGYYEPKVDPLLSMTRWLSAKKISASGRVCRTVLRGLHKCSWATWTLRAFFSYDVFIFAFGQSLWPKNRDLFVLRMLGKTIISNLGHGSEARPAFMNGAHLDLVTGAPLPIAVLVDKCKDSAAMVGRHEKYANVIIGSPMTSHFLSRPFINFLTLGLPTGRPFEWASDSKLGPATKRPNPNVTIIHAPSNPRAKGTSEIMKAVSNLTANGYQIDFRLLEGASNIEVGVEVANSDFIIDQVYGDSPMAGFVAEAAWLGKPAVVCGYDFPSLKKTVPMDLWPPSHTCSPDNLEIAIEKMIVDEAFRTGLGESARKFVRTEWRRASVARKYVSLIRGSYPLEWTVHPESVNYVFGLGQNKNTTVQLIRAIVERLGPMALQVRRKSTRDALLRFAGLLD